MKKHEASVLELADRHVWGACVYDVRVQVPSLAPSEQGPEFGAQKWDNPDSGLFFYAKTPVFKPFFEDYLIL